MPEHYTILIVDDEPDMRSAIRRSLRHPSYTLLEACNGVEALELLRSLPPGAIDAIVSDFEMPRMDGLALLQQVRLVYPQLLRILLTARADVHIAIRALNEGAVHRFLLKPWDRIDLRGIIEMGIHTQQPASRSAVGG